MSKLQEYMLAAQTQSPEWSNLGFLEVCNLLAPLPQVMQDVVPASPSSVDKMNTCPRQFDAAYKGIHVNKVQFKQNVYAFRGDVIHNAAEMWLKAKRKSWEFPAHISQHLHEALMSNRNFTIHDIPAIDPANMQVFGVKLDKLRELIPDPIIEDQTAINAQGSTAWQGRAMGAKSDYIGFMQDGAVALYCDWKTGKVRDKPLQLEMTAYVLFNKYPELQAVIAELVFVDQAETIRYVYRRDSAFGWKNNAQCVPLQYVQSLPRYWNLQQRTCYDPTPNGLCSKWCDVVDCSHNGRA